MPAYFAMDPSILEQLHRCAICHVPVWHGNLEGHTEWHQAQEQSSEAVAKFLAYLEAGADLDARMKSAPIPVERITPTIAAHVLHFLGESGGLETSHFRSQLLRLIKISDAANRDLLELAYPAYVMALRIGEASAQGVMWLQALAELQAPDDAVKAVFLWPTN